MPFVNLKLKWAWQAWFLSYIPKIFKKCVFFEAAQMILLPYCAKSYGFNFEKNANEFQSILQQSLPRIIYKKNQKNDIIETEIAYGLKRKFEDERAKRRNILKLPPKLGGKTKGTNLAFFSLAFQSTLKFASQKGKRDV